METAQDKLLKWYKKNHRKLPFRETKEAYKIWVSEIMLQQTRVAAMLESYQRFIKKFPNIQKLAESSEEEVIQYWHGLGYYSRAINLQKGAVFVKENFNLNFPDSYQDALRIPGVGPYTARAVLSIAYDKPFAVVDGNVKRVLARYFFFDKNISLPNSTKTLQELADDFLNEKDPSTHNQALMELGATICTPRPDCEICPIQSNCKAFQKGKQTQLPVQNKNTDKIKINMKFFLLEHQDKVLMIRDNQRRFFKKIYSLPYLIEGKNLDQSYKNDHKFIEYLNSIHYQCFKFSAKHSITNHDIVVSLCKSSLPDSEIPFLKNMDFKWVDFQDIRDEFPSSISDKLKYLIKKYIDEYDLNQELPLKKMLALKKRFGKSD